MKDSKKHIFRTTHRFDNNDTVNRENDENVLRKISININTSKCIKCKKCIEACKRAVLMHAVLMALSNSGKNIMVENTGNCTGCLRCMKVCPQGAITVTRHK